MVLTCHVISQDCMAQEPSDFFGRSTSRQVTNLLHLVAIDTVLVKISRFWFDA